MIIALSRACRLEAGDNLQMLSAGFLFALGDSFVRFASGADQVLCTLGACLKFVWLGCLGVGLCAEK